MPDQKTDTLSFRVKPAIKTALRALSEKENRSQANMIEIMVLDFCARHGIEVGSSTSDNGDAAS